MVSYVTHQHASMRLPIADHGFLILDVVFHTPPSAAHTGVTEPAEHQEQPHKVF